MATDLVEYFVRHYTLVMDNDQGTYNMALYAARESVKEQEPELTVAEYKAMGSEQRRNRFAYDIGASVLALIEEWVTDAMDQIPQPARMFIDEIMITNGSDIAYELGKHYMPEDYDLEEWLPEGDDEDQDDE